MSAEPSRRVAPVPLRLTTHTDGNDTVRLAVAGEIDLATVGPLTDTMIEIIKDDRPAHLVVDFAEVAFLDSSGVSALVAAWNLASASQVGFTVVNCRPNVLRVLEITGMAKALTTGSLDHA
jgi:anti-sigma B factor antagonist